MTSKDRQIATSRRPFNEGALSTDQGIPAADPGLIAYDDWSTTFIDDFLAALSAHWTFDREVSAVPA